MGKSVFERGDRKPLIKNILVGVVGVGLCIWGIVALFAVLNGDKLQSGPDSSAASRTESSDAATQPPETSAPTQPPTDPPASSSSSTPPTDPSSTQPEGVDDQYFDDAVFIGDSRTQGLMLYGGLPGGTTFYAAKGVNVGTVGEATVKDGGEDVTIYEALKRHTFGKVYIMLGVNELGWASEKTFIARYGELLDEIRNSQPDAVLYVQSILPVSKTKSDSSIYTNSRIDLYNNLIKQMCEEKQAVYLDVAEAVRDESGALPEEATVDGIHLKKDYCLKWTDYIRTHTVPG